MKTPKKPKIVLLSERSERKGHRAVAITSQLPENLRFSVIPKRNSGSGTREAELGV